MLQQIGRKLKQQVRRFSGELSVGLGKVASRFVEEMVYGISATGSVKLTEAARALEEGIALHATHKRLSARLDEEGLGARVSANLLRVGAPTIRPETLLIVDPSEVTKKYARKMQYLATVRDGSAQTFGNGYWLCAVVGCEVDGREIVPLSQRLWSQAAPEVVSENATVREQVAEVLAATDYRGILVYDRGGDRRELLVPWTQDRRVRYLVRQRGDRQLAYKGKRKSGTELAGLCKTPYAETVVREKDGKEQVYFLEFGFLPVRLPEHAARPLWLVVVKGFGAEPLLLLTTQPLRLNRAVVWWVVRAYLTRWRIEETIRFIKQSYEFEDVRVLTYRRLQNLAVLVLAAAQFAAVWLGARLKLEVLAEHVLDAAKRIFGVPDFKYYALADGLAAIFRRVGKGLLPEPDNEHHGPLQLRLFYP